MKAHTKRRRYFARVGRRIRLVEKRQDRLTREVLNAVVHLLEEYIPSDEPINRPKRAK